MTSSSTTSNRSTPSACHSASLAALRSSSAFSWSRELLGLLELLRLDGRFLLLADPDDLVLEVLVVGRGRHAADAQAADPASSMRSMALSGRWRSAM